MSEETTNDEDPRGECRHMLYGPAAPNGYVFTRWDRYDEALESGAYFEYGDWCAHQAETAVMQTEAGADTAAELRDQIEAMQATIDAQAEELVELKKENATLKGQLTKAKKAAGAGQ